MQINMKHCPPDIIQRYNLHEKVAIDEYVYIKIKKGVYGLKKSTVLSYNNLVKNIAHHSYVPCKYSTGIWRHATNKA